MNDGIGLAERLPGLHGFHVREVNSTPRKVVITVQSNRRASWGA